MRPQLADLRSGNPALTADTFRNARATFGEEAMTVAGTANKTAIALLLLILAAAYTWNVGASNPAAVGGLTLVGAIGGLIVAMATVFKQTWAPVTTPIYSVLEGLVLGGISSVMERRYPGIVVQAVFLTFGTLAALLVAYRSGLIKVTDRFRAGVFAATGGIFLFYMIGFVMSFFGASLPLVNSATPFGIVFSLVVVGIAALNLVLDFDFIESGARARAPKYMEWYGAFGLMVTLVWLYLEILRLLAKLQRRD
ncbi:MAG TPA: Bax inhibitor-1/YccA family protein [Candidatus Binatia bacterium]|nr:Bax inhibitor-1/YccA family protein [Candidatus Binatia bacterium]